MERLQKVKITQIEMVRDRGYDIGPELEVLGMNTETFETHFANEADRLGVKLGSSLIRPVLNRLYFTPNRSESIYVYYAGSDKLTSTNVVTARNYISVLSKSKPTSSILIITARLGHVAEKEIYKHVIRHGIKFQIFYEKDLTFNPTQHRDVPIHHKLSEEQKLEKLAEMRVLITQLPLIRQDDPIAKYYGWMVGDLIQIHHTNQSNIIADQSLNYRVVIAPYVPMTFTLEENAKLPAERPETDYSTMTTAMQSAIVPDAKPDRQVDYLSYN